MKVVLAATDFSAAASNAVAYAAEMAVAIKAKLVLLHIYQIPVTQLQAPGIDSEIKNIADQQLQQLKTNLVKAISDKIIIDIILISGIYFNALNEVCQTLQPYLVFIGGQRSNGVAPLKFGQHAVHAMQHLKWPLITVPNHARFSEIKTIGLACDLEKLDDTIPVNDIALLVQEFNAELHVFNTSKQKVYSPGISFQSNRLQQILAALKPSYHFTTNPDIDEGILDFIERTRVDLFVMLPGRFRLIKGLLHRHQTTHNILRSPAPVIAAL